MATLAELNKAASTLLASVVESYVPNNGTDQLQAGIEELYSVTLHACNGYCTNHKICAKFWQLADKGQIINFYLGDDTTLFFKRSTWNKIEASATKIAEFLDAETTNYYDIEW